METGPALSLILQVAEALTGCTLEGRHPSGSEAGQHRQIVPDQGDSSREQAKILDFGIAKMAESQGMGPALAKPRSVFRWERRFIWHRSSGKARAKSRTKPTSTRSASSSTDAVGAAAVYRKLRQRGHGAHILATPRPLNELAPNVPPEVVDLVHQMLQKVPADRPSILVVTRELRRILGLNTEMSMPGQAVPMGGAPGMPSGPLRTTQRPPGLRTSQIGLRQTGAGAQGPLSDGRQRESGRNFAQAFSGWARRPTASGRASDPASDPAGNSQNAMQNPAQAQSPKWQKFALIGSSALWSPPVVRSLSRCRRPRKAGRKNRRSQSSDPGQTRRSGRRQVLGRRAKQHHAVLQDLWGTGRRVCGPWAKTARSCAGTARQGPTQSYPPARTSPI